MMGSRGSDEAEEEVVVVSVATCKIVSLHRVSDCWDVGVLKSTHVVSKKEEEYQDSEYKEYQNSENK